jgi:hypothetical protein
MILKENKKITSGHLHGQYRIVVNPKTRMVYDFELKKYIKYRKWNHFTPKNPVSDGRKMPMIGFMCDECKCCNNYEKLFLVNDRVVHESCALKVLNDKE